MVSAKLPGRFAAPSHWFLRVLLAVLPTVGLHGSDTPAGPVFVSLAPAAGGDAVSRPVAGDGTFVFEGLAPGVYLVALTSQPMTKQTQGATFGERVNAGPPRGKVRHDTAQNSISNMRGFEGEGTRGEARPVAGSPDRATGQPSGQRPKAVAAESSPGASSADAPAQKAGKIDSGMPARISMNVTIARVARELEVDGTVVEVEVGQDRRLAGRVELRPARRADDGGADPREAKGRG